VKNAFYASFTFSSFPAQIRTAEFYKARPYENDKTQGVEGDFA